MKDLSRGSVARAASYPCTSRSPARATCTSCRRPPRIDIELRFLRPFECDNTATFTFTPTPEGTKVTWAMEGQNGFLAKAASLVFDMDTPRSRHRDTRRAAGAPERS